MNQKTPNSGNDSKPQVGEPAVLEKAGGTWQNTDFGAILLKLCGVAQLCVCLKDLLFLVIELVQMLRDTLLDMHLKIPSQMFKIKNCSPSHTFSK